MPVTTYTVIEGEVVSQNQDGTIHDFLPDPLGHTLGLISTDETIEFEWDYFPYEQVPTAFDGATALRYGGTRGYYSDNYSRPHVGARELRTVHGRWMQVDPIWPEEPAYTYCRDKPVSYTDPSGLQMVPYWHPTDVETKNKGCQIARLLASLENQDLYSSVNDCVRASGMACPPFKKEHLNCLISMFCGDRISYHFNDPVVCCADGPCARIKYVTGNVVVPGQCLKDGGGYIVYYCPKANNSDCNPLGTWVPYSDAVLHEVLHCCGIKHGAGTEPNTCNSILTCCLLKAIGWNPIGHQCFRR